MEARDVHASAYQTHLIDLYRISVDEHHFYVTTRQNRITYYTNLLVAMTAGCVAGLMQADEPLAYLAVAGAGLLVALVSSKAGPGTQRPHDSFLDAISVRAKIEEDLGLTNSSIRSHFEDASRDSEAWWRREPVVPSRHLASRRKFESSEDWYRENRTRGYIAPALQLYSVFWWSGIAVMAISFLGLLQAV